MEGRRPCILGGWEAIRYHLQEDRERERRKWRETQAETGERRVADIQATTTRALPQQPLASLHAPLPIINSSCFCSFISKSRRIAPIKKESSETESGPVVAKEGEE